MGILISIQWGWDKKLVEAKFKDQKVKSIRKVAVYH
jgi:hypothetical protein